MIKTIKKICKLTQTELFSYLYKKLTSFYGEERLVKHEQFIMAFGDVPVGLIAHLDTVHTVVPSEIFYDQEQQVIWSPQGIGADDRAGVYAILSILEQGLKPTVIFTTDEEIGGLGAQALITTLSSVPIELNLLIQLDRRGRNQSVFYYCDNPEFTEYINQFGFCTATGSFSDISIICPQWEVAGVNLSIGYFNEHSLQEYWCLTYTQETIDKVKQIIIDQKTNPKYFKYIGLTDYSYFYNNEIIEEHDYGLCWCCLEQVDSYDLISTEEFGEVCKDCYSKYFGTCDLCYREMYDININNSGFNICSNCCSSL